MQVLTRAGYKPVRASAETRKAAEVITVEFSDGKSLTGTPEHPVWVSGKGWTRLDALVWRDTIATCQENQFYSTELSSRATPTLPAELLGCITTRIKSTGRRVYRACIKRFGRLQTGQYPRVAKSITKTPIRLTTGLTTSSLLPRKSTANATLKSFALLDSSILTESDRSLVNGTGLTRVKSFTSALVKNLGAIVNRLSAYVNTAARSTAPYQAALASAHGPVSIKAMKQASVITRQEPAPSARQSSRQGPQRTFKPVPVHVVKSYAGEKADVYNLSVDDMHEYYANGVLVHNCWLWSTLLEPTSNRRPAKHARF